MSEDFIVQDNIDGYESKEFLDFRFSLRRLFDAVARGVGLERFQELYSDVLGKSRAKNMYNALVQSMANGMMKELEQGIVDDELDSKYKKLSQIVGAYEGQKDIKAWRPPGDISQHIRSHLAAEKLKMKEELEKIVKTGDVEIYLLQQDVLKKRAMARNLGDRITSLMNQMYSEGNKVNDFYNYQNRICEILLEHV